MLYLLTLKDISSRWCPVLSIANLFSHIRPCIGMIIIRKLNLEKNDIFSEDAVLAVDEKQLLFDFFLFFFFSFFLVFLYRMMGNRFSLTYCVSLVALP
jgi:hypothetical protein